MPNLGTIFQKLQPVSKKIRVVETLKEAILTGALQSGDQIVEGKLAQQLGVGQGLIREALIELEHQGFVQRSPFSWTQVTTLTNADAEQIYEIRIRLEPLAFALAAQTATAEQIAGLRELIAKAREGAVMQALPAFFESHLAYRRKVWELSGNRFLRETLERLVAPLYALFLMRADFNREGLLQTIEACLVHQEETLRAFDARDAQEAERVVRKFLEQMQHYLGSKLLPEKRNE
jgi:DNA-binding GntR family transcriptional regulator